jgi:hypothetical protein
MHAQPSQPTVNSSVNSQQSSGQHCDSRCVRAETFICQVNVAVVAGKIAAPPPATMPPCSHQPDDGPRYEITKSQSSQPRLAHILEYSACGDRRRRQATRIRHDDGEHEVLPVNPQE